MHARAGPIFLFEHLNNVNVRGYFVDAREQPHAHAMILAVRPQTGIISSIIVSRYYG